MSFFVYVFTVIKKKTFTIRNSVKITKNILVLNAHRLL